MIEKCLRPTSILLNREGRYRGIIFVTFFSFYWIKVAAGWVKVILVADEVKYFLTGEDRKCKESVENKKMIKG